MTFQTKASKLRDYEKIVDQTVEKLFSEEPSEVEAEEKPKRKLHTLDVYVIFSISALVIYTIISQVLVVVCGASLDTLTTCFFAFFGGEITASCLIKIFKLKDKKDDGGGVG